MTKEEYEELEPFLKTLNQDQQKVVWYIEARKRGNTCLTEEQKEAALSDTLTDHHKIKLHDWHKTYSNTD